MTDRFNGHYRCNIKLVEYLSVSIQVIFLRLYMSTVVQWILTFDNYGSYYETLDLGWFTQVSEEKK